MYTKFTSYDDVCDFLDNLGLFHMDLSLKRMENALLALSVTKLPFFTIQVVGTNGKGSTSTFLEALAREHGLRTGLFTSPHFVSPKERILIHGKALPEEFWASLATKIHQVAPNLTYFEFLTMLALLAFAEKNVDIAILEAGLGGHYDATSACTRNALCLTPISMDHESVLGNTLLAIAEDKAKAIGKYMPVFMGEQDPQVSAHIQEVCAQQQATLHKIPSASSLLTNSSLGLHGKHQKENAALALCAWQHLAKAQQWPYEEHCIQQALRNAFIPGRLQHIHCTEQNLPPHLLLDGAHNVQGLQTLIEYVQQLPTKPSAIIFSCLADKDQQGLLNLLKVLLEVCENSKACPLYLVDIQNNNRALSFQEKNSFKQNLEKSDAKVVCIPSIHEALALTQNFVLQNQCQNSPVLLCGSLYLLGEFFSQYPQYLKK